MKKVLIVGICLIFNLKWVLCQGDTAAVLNTFFNTYLQSNRINRLNDLSNQQLFNKRYHLLINRVEDVLRKDSLSDLKCYYFQFINHLRSSQAQLKLNSIFPSSRLFSIESYYYLDSMRKKMLINKQLSDSFFHLAFKQIENAVEIGVPFFTNNNSFCFIVYVRHLNYWPESKVLLFELKNGIWKFKKEIFNHSYYLDDEKRARSSEEFRLIKLNSTPTAKYFSHFNHK